MNQNISELRQDIVSGEWVTIAMGRAKRPHDFLSVPRKRFDQPKETCPFDTSLEDPILTMQKKTDGKAPPTDEQWFVKVVKNKFPAFSEGQCYVTYHDGIYMRMDGVGSHEVVVTRDHDRSIAQFSDEEAALVIRAYQIRFQELKKGECTQYISIFHNHGPESGATIAHPHSQVVSLPVIPPDIQRSLNGARNYFKTHNKCVHCTVIEFEIQKKSRIIYENVHCVVVCPYASKTAFEMRLFPKKHMPEFTALDDEETASVGDALKEALRRIYAGLNDPSYNFFIHTAPSFDHIQYPEYHWHIEILPKTAIWAGFEIGTGIEISTIAPESAAEFLRSIQ